MVKSLKLWCSIAKHYPDWEVWLNKKGNDGTLLDDDDNVSFINKDIKKAVKISHQPDGSFDFAYWVSTFDPDEDPIDVINIIFNDYKKAKTEFAKVFQAFLADV